MEVSEFSHRTRARFLQRLESEIFDLLIVGGGITGAATAREAALRGIKVALIEKGDFASGTSSRSSKLIHGGLRYLESLEFRLVFEALSQRSHLLNTMPHLVKPMTFYYPIYENSPKSRFLLTCGLTLYDLLALFRAPGFHRWVARDEVLKELPNLRSSGLLGAFRYFDASMWDDVITLQTLREAADFGAVIVNYCKAENPIWGRDYRRSRILGFDKVRARQVIVCVGPWLDHFFQGFSPDWVKKLSPSMGIHLVFDHQRFPLNGSVVMTHPQDGRIAFALPRMDLGNGVVIVGTTDQEFKGNPDEAGVDDAGKRYLFQLLGEYFPKFNLTHDDVVSSYAGVRPLMAPEFPQWVGEQPHQHKLQKVSREHRICIGPGGMIFVIGGKYTTHRVMGHDIINFALEKWRERVRSADADYFPTLKKFKVNKWGHDLKSQLPKNPGFENRYGEHWQVVQNYQKEIDRKWHFDDPPGFSCLGGQLLYSVRHEMLMHLEDFYLRRTPLYLARKDHGIPWITPLLEILGGEFKISPQDRDTFFQNEYVRGIQRWK